MRKEEITSKEMKQCICLRTGKLNFSEVTDEDIENITTMDLRGVKFNGEPTDVILSELEALPNLNALMISHFDLNVEDINNLSKLSKLKTIQFTACDFDNITDIKLEELDILVFVGCTDMGTLKMPKSRVLRVIGSEINFDGVNPGNIEKLLLQNTLVKNFTTLASNENLVEVNLDGSTIQDKDGKAVKDIEVAAGTFLSYEEEFEPEER